MSRSILAIADENEDANLILEKAYDFIAPLNANLEVVRFLPHMGSQDEVVRKQTMEQAKRTLDHDIFDVFGEDARVKCNVIRTDKIADWVVEACKQQCFDLVVKTRQRTEDLFRSPTDRQLMRQISCPFLVLNNHKRKSKQVVLTAINLTRKGAQRKELNTLVLQWAGLWSEIFSCSAHVAYSVPIAKDLLEHDSGETSKYQKRTQPETEKQLSKLLEQFKLDHAHTHITAEPPERSIYHIAYELKADLVVMACAERQGLIEFLIGNITESVLHQLPTDILVIGAGALKTRNEPWILT